MKPKVSVRFVLVSLAALASTSASRAGAPEPARPGAPDAVEFSREPAHRYLIDNAFVDIAELELKPDAATRMHRHRHAFVAVALTAGEVSDEISGKAPVVLKLREGQVRFTEGGLTHVVRNLGKAPFRERIVGLERDAQAHQAGASGWDEAGNTKAAGGARRETLFIKDGMRVSSVVLPPGSVEPPRARATAELLVAISEVDVGQGDSAAKLEAGRTQWRGGRYVGTLSNNGKKTARLVFLEFK